MNSPEHRDPFAELNERPTTMTSRVKKLADHLSVGLAPIEKPTEELARTNMMRSPDNAQLPSGLREAVLEVTHAVHTRELARAQAMRYPLTERGTIEIAPPQYQAAHEVTKKLNSALSLVRGTLENTVDPRVDGKEIPGCLIDSSEPFSTESEEAVLDMLGVDPSAVHDRAPDTVTVVDGGEIYTTSVETPDGVVYSRETHIDTSGNQVAFFGKILKAA